MEAPHIFLRGIEPDLAHGSMSKREVLSQVNGRKIFFDESRFDGIRVFHERIVYKYMLVHVAADGLVIMSIRTNLIDIEKGQLVGTQNSHEISLLRNRIIGILVGSAIPAARCPSCMSKHGGRNQDEEQKNNQIHFSEGYDTILFREKAYQFCF